jgi:hypothetical protein
VFQIVHSHELSRFFEGFLNTEYNVGNPGISASQGGCIDTKKRRKQQSGIDICCEKNADCFAFASITCYRNVCYYVYVYVLVCILNKGVELIWKEFKEPSR